MATQATLKALLVSSMGEMEYRLAPTAIAHRKGDVPAMAQEGIEAPIYKHTIGNRKALIGRRYTDAVNGQRIAEEKDADFEALKATGKHFVQGSAVLMESDREEGLLYVAIQPQKASTSVEFRDKNGRILNMEQTEAYVPVRFRKPEGGSSRQGTEEKTLWITPKMAGFTYCKVMGREWSID